ncbi:coiled-coil domain-containing protein 32 [Pelodytes ibericus]
MRMIENLDIGTPASGHDLWAEICPCPSDTRQESLTEEFSDSFLCSSDSTNQTEFQDGSLHDAELSTPKPWAPLKDSQVYLASLERRLQKIKGLSHEVTSKDMLRSLGQAKKECWDRFLQETFETEAYVESSDVDDSTLEQLKRWLQPEKVAINAEEMQCLIPAISPSTNVEDEQTPESAEQ